MQRIHINSMETAYDFFSTFGRSFSFDTETSSPAIREFIRQNPNNPVPEDIQAQALNYYYLELEAMSFCDGKNAGVVFFSEVHIKPFLALIKEVFAKAKTIVGHNISYDMKVMKKYGIDMSINRIYCTMTADHLLNENRRHGLKYLAKELLGKEETITYLKARRMGGQIFIDYILNDAIWTWELMKYQQPLLKNENVVDLFRNVEMPFQNVLVEMESEGIYVDTQLARETEEILKQAKEDFTVEMLNYLGEKFLVQNTLDGHIQVISPINFESSQQLAEICRDRFKLPCVEKTPGGQYSVGKVFLQEYRDHEFIKILQKYKIASQLYKLFFKPMHRFITPEGKIHASFNNTGTKTGRLSSSRPNLQQLSKPNDAFPIETRKCFIAGTGRKMVSIDFSSQEVRVMAQISKDKTLVDALNKGLDMHLSVANTFYTLGIPEECLMETHPEFEKYKSQYKKERQAAKCFHPDTEVLTKSGWKRITNLFEGEEVIQATPVNGECLLEWVKPLEVFSKENKLKKLIHLKNGGINLRVTPDHRMLEFDKSGNHVVTIPEVFGKRRYWQNAGTLLKNHSDYSPNVARFLAALQADGSITKLGAVRFGFTKIRKIKRLTTLLHNLNINFSFKKQKNMEAFYIPRREVEKYTKFLDEKKFTFDFLNYSEEFCLALIDELRFWDSSNPNKRNVYNYNSTVEQNVDVIQALCSLHNIKTYKRFNGHIYVLSIRNHSHSRGGNVSREEIDFPEKVSCISVPSTFVLVRDGGIPIITGQTITFGLAYGKTNVGFAKDFGVSDEEAQGMIDKYFENMQGLSQSIKNAHKELDKKGFVTYLSGRKRHFEKIQRDNWEGYPRKAYRQAFNALIQGYSGDMMRIAMNKVYEERKKFPEYDIRILATVHDEMIVTCREGCEQQTAELLKQCFETCVDLIVPVVADYGIGDSYADAK